MKKICFVFGGNVQMCPYLKSYLKFLDEEKEFDVIYWERYKFKQEYVYEKKPSKEYIYKRKVTNAWNKLLGAISFKNYVISILERNNYEKIVFLQTNMAIMCGGYIKRQKDKQYLLDIRDYSHERNVVIQHIEKDIFKYIDLILISSEGFKKFLPENYMYKVMHNIQTPGMIAHNDDLKRADHNSAINVMYIGNMSKYTKYLCSVMERFKNDQRYLFGFVGIGSELIEKYCKDNDIYNVEIKGEFAPDEINDLYLKADIVNNLYGHNDLALDYALSNKLYLAAQFAIPILTCEGTYMSEISSKYGFGYTIKDKDKDINDKLYNWYTAIEYEKIYENCKTFIEEVENENAKTLEKIVEFFEK